MSAGRADARRGRNKKFFPTDVFLFFCSSTLFLLFSLVIRIIPFAIDVDRSGRRNFNSLLYSSKSDFRCGNNYLQNLLHEGARVNKFYINLPSLFIKANNFD